jgi:hypothetical protein
MVREALGQFDPSAVSPAGRIRTLDPERGGCRGGEAK